VPPIPSTTATRISASPAEEDEVTDEDEVEEEEVTEEEDVTEELDVG